MTVLLYDRIVSILEEYLGPAAPRFVARQVSFHLQKAPQDLAAGDLPKLAEWTRVTLNLLTDDRELVEECVRKVAEA